MALRASASSAVCLSLLSRLDPPSNRAGREGQTVDEAEARRAIVRASKHVRSLSLGGRSWTRERQPYEPRCPPSPVPLTRRVWALSPTALRQEEENPDETEPRRAAVRAPNWTGRERENADEVEARKATAVRAFSRDRRDGDVFATQRVTHTYYTLLNPAEARDQRSCTPGLVDGQI